MKKLRQVFAVAIGLSVLLPSAAIWPQIKPESLPGSSRVATSPGSVGNPSEQVYIVQLAEPPATARVASTRRGRQHGHRRFNAKAPEVRAYVDRLKNSHDQLLGKIGSYDRKIYSYGYTFNGFAVRLNEQQAAKLKTRRGVVGVWKDHLRRVETANSPAFLGLTNPVGGLTADLGLRGEGVIIGVIDSGITQEHPSFSERRQLEPPRLCRGAFGDSLLGLFLCRRFDTESESEYGPPPASWNGVCEAGENFGADACNNKLIGARFYRAGFDLISTRDVNEFDSPRDADGHGTHIASIAAGNSVPATLFGASIGTVSGMAPRARIAVYKACWLESGGFRSVCSVADLQQAIEDAVKDGVDIINYSISDSADSLDDPDDLALLAAADAGILSVVAAGNEGPMAETILGPGGTPWVLTAGATSRAGEKFEEAIRVNQPVSIAGNYASREAAFTPSLSTVGPITGLLELVNDDFLGIDSEGTLGTFDDGCETFVNGSSVQGRIAFIQRGLCEFQIKVENAQSAGAIAVVVFNNQGDPILMGGIRNTVTIPAVMIGEADGMLLRDRIATGETVEVTLDQSVLFSVADTGNAVDSFSARGPNLTDLNFLKPDVVAPGVNILAGQTPDVANGIRGELFQYLSGTSQSVPHVAGIAALIAEAHPQWSPTAIKSALMTTARQDIVKEDRQTPADAFDMGAGHIAPNQAVDPGLVYETTTEDFDAYLCGTSTPRLSDSECAALLGANPAPSGEALNLPSIAVSVLGATTTVTRTVTNVGPAEQYSVSVTAPTAIGVSVSPTMLSLGSGESAAFKVTFTNQGAEPGIWQQGSLTWESAEHSVRSPFVVRTVALVAPEQVDGSTITGSVQIPVEFGYNGSYEAQVHGLRPACILPATVDDLESGCQDTSTVFIADDPFNEYVLFDPTALPDYIQRIEFDVPADQRLLRISLFQRFVDDGNGNDDLDIIVYRCTELLDPAASCTRFFFLDQGIRPFTSDEQVDLPFPAAGHYVVDIHGFETDEVNGGPGANTSLYVWAVGDNDNQGALVIGGDPASVSAGSTAILTADWNSLAPALYLGGISHVGRDNNGDLITTDQDGNALITLINIDAN
jgi:subtilisin family serine protease